jgi:bis(5'-nucleosyl)-tetraphosphatase (symmetrical)
MATYAIGDLQGCADALDRLLDALCFDAGADRLWLVGDLVNRGPASLRTLRRIRSLGTAAQVVLGNHDLHLLALACGVRRPSHADTLDEILAAPDAEELIDWLRHQPLVHAETLGSEEFLMVHAGLPPQWSAQIARLRAAEVEAALASADWQDFVADLYGDQPARWEPGLAGHERLRLIVNYCTRMRFCKPDGTLDLDSKEGVDRVPAGFAPWFDLPERAASATTIVFGHWSTLGLLCRGNLLGLDTGCVWGGALTAVRLDNRSLYQVACPQYRAPG